jgi:hypothetical protein
MEELSFKIARMRGLRDEVTADSQSGVPEALFVYSYCLHRHAGRRTVRYHGKSVREVADIVGVAEATVKTRMFYARKKLAELVET